MSKEQVVQKLLKERINTAVKYHTQLPPELSPWYVYTEESGHRILCVLKSSLNDAMNEADYNDRLVSAPVKTVLRGHTVQDGFVIVDCGYDPVSGFASEQEDREFEADVQNTKFALTVGGLYHPGRTSWPEAVEYNYFSSNHELRFILKSPARYITEVIRKMPVQLGLFTQDDLVLLVYRFTDYKKHLIPVHGYSPFFIHLVPENMRTLPEPPADPEHEELLRIHLVDADTGILTAARSIMLSPEFSAALCSAIIKQAGMPFAPDYNEQLRRIDAMFPGDDELMNICSVKCTG